MSKAKQQWEPDSPVLGYDPKFGGLDLSGVPLGAQLERIAEADDDGNDPFAVDERFAKPDTSSRSQALKRFIKSAPDDVETLADLDKSNPQLAKELRESSLREFHYQGWTVTPVRTTANKVHCTATNDSTEEVLNFVLTGITDQNSLMDAATDHIREITGPAPPTIRDLTEREILSLQRQSQAGDMREAICNYLKFRIGEAAFSNSNDPWDLLGDPAYRDVTNDAAYDCWRWSNNHYIRNEQFEEWLRNAAEEKPLTVEVINALYFQFQEHRERQKRNTLLGIGETATPAEAPSPAAITASLDDMTDEQIDALRRSTLRELARQHRAGRGR